VSRLSGSDDVITETATQAGVNVIIISGGGVRGGAGGGAW